MRTIRDSISSAGIPKYCQTTLRRDIDLGKDIGRHPVDADPPRTAINNAITTNVRYASVQPNNPHESPRAPFAADQTCKRSNAKRRASTIDRNPTPIISRTFGQPIGNKEGGVSGTGEALV